MADITWTLGVLSAGAENVQQLDQRNPGVLTGLRDLAHRRGRVLPLRTAERALLTGKDTSSRPAITTCTGTRLSTSTRRHP